MTDNAYQTKTYRFQNLGVNARAVYDALPPGTYQNLRNLESRAENAIASRYGMKALTTDGTKNLPLSGAVRALDRMKALTQTYRYAATDDSLNRITGDGQGGFSSIATGLTGSVTSTGVYRPDNNANPYMFVANSGKLLKDNGSGNAQSWGISPPVAPCTASIFTPPYVFMDLFDANSFTANSGLTSVSINTRVSFNITPIPTTGFQFVTESQPVVRIAGLHRVSGVTTVICFSHSYSTGQKVTISCPGSPKFTASGVVITVTSSTNFTYNNPGPDESNLLSPATVSAMPSLAPGMFVAIGGFGNPGFYWAQVAQVTATGFFAIVQANPNIQFADARFLKGNVAANTVATVSRALPINLSQLSNFIFSVEGTDDDIVQLWINVNDPASLAEIRISFFCGDGDYFYKSINPATWQAAASGNQTNSQVVNKRVFDRAAARADNRRLGFKSKDLMPDDLADLRWIRPVELNTGLGAWTLIKAYKSEFARVGNAGTEGFDWSLINSYQITIKTGPITGVTIGFDDLAVISSGPDALSGDPYDYRVTYYDINTGCESSPNQAMVEKTFITPQRQAVQVAFFNPNQPSVTHAKIYRRGGTLTQGWYFVDRVAVPANGAKNAYLDTASDAAIETNALLEIDNNAPVTTVLPVSVNTTIKSLNGVASTGGGGLINLVFTNATNISSEQLITIGTPNNQEQVIVISDPVNSVNGFTSLVWLQNPHSAGEPITATTRPRTPMSLLAIAFDKAWLAGDPNNPHKLYYSRPFRPETFPVQNSIEVGSPDAPIMALIETRGLLYVLTTKRVYQVLGAGTSVPVIIPTSVKHGLVSSQAWATAENVIYYLSYDGVYAFQGAGSAYLSESVEWIWTSKNLGPIQAMDPAAVAQTTMAYGNHELFVSYTGLDGARHRMIWHDVYKRWRNDDSGQTDIFAMNFEEDTGKLIVGGLDGMVYQDRTGESDWGTYDSSGTFVPTPIPFTMQTAQMDMEAPKAFKQYNELTLDMDTSGQDVNISLVFDNGATILAIGKFNCSGRQQVQINVNNGQGQRSQNVGLLITGNATAPVTLYEVSIRALVEAEFRRSFDSYWLKYGTDEWKTGKQGWFEYACADAVTFNVYQEGDMSAPVFTFTLPASATRKTEKVRFPATKATTWRFIATATSDFQLYPESHIEIRPVCGPKGYSKEKLMA
jgi:hypothetical protein